MSTPRWTWPTAGRGASSASMSTHTCTRSTLCPTPSETAIGEATQASGAPGQAPPSPAAPAGPWFGTRSRRLGCTSLATTSACTTRDCRPECRPLSMATIRPCRAAHGRGRASTRPTGFSWAGSARPTSWWWVPKEAVTPCSQCIRLRLGPPQNLESTGTAPPAWPTILDPSSGSRSVSRSGTTATCRPPCRIRSLYTCASSLPPRAEAEPSCGKIRWPPNNPSLCRRPGTQCTSASFHRAGRSSPYPTLALHTHSGCAPAISPRPLHLRPRRRLRSLPRRRTRRCPRRRPRRRPVCLPRRADAPQPKSR
mmetsp:Transcript_2595/g.8239  ORF Transcript_2595/g.8239 Transcript_2595/m.8239 type:complete len:310 (-) Transcript_2595:787-1716(-)